MSLEPGHRLAHYEILELVGRGGIGEVYRARDTKLGRDVAIKVLTDALSQDKERLDRFEREARLLAQLNHTNIATLHGLEDHDGQPFLVMEMVEGETLADRIASGPIPVDEAIPLFIEIADGLQAAHEKKVLHRDLKPANIKIGTDGKPKILDFGLAKAFGAEEDVSAGTSQSPTLTKATAHGVVLGTASYMSPEQARGKPVDKRTDIWAFGCCLYEALTGKKAFDGQTVTDVLAAVVKSEPSLDALPPETTWRLRELLSWCFRKEQRRRLREISVAGVYLEAALDEPESHVVHETTPRSASAWLVIVATAIAASLVTWMATSKARDPQPVNKVRVGLQPGKTLGVSYQDVNSITPLSRTAMVFLPDGRGLIFSAEGAGPGQLYLRRLDERDAMPIAGTDVEPTRLDRNSAWLARLDARWRTTFIFRARRKPLLDAVGRQRTL